MRFEGTELSDNFYKGASEDDLKRLVFTRLNPYFEIKSEVEGVFLVDDTKVRIDFLLRPNEETKRKGFDSGYVGVEVKGLGNIDDRVKKGLSVAWQSITYSQSKFGTERPMFVLLFPPLDKFLIGREGERFGLQYVNILLQKANVGILRIFKEGWVVQFASQPYFSSEIGRSKIENLGLKKQVGTKK